MSSSPTGSSSPDDASLQAWAAEVGKPIPEGEAWTISKVGDQARLDRGPIAERWKDVYPELHGYVQGLEARIDDATGCMPLVIALAVAGGLCVLATWIFPENKKVACGIVFAICIGLWLKYDDIHETRVYRNERDELLARLRREGIDPNTLVAWLAKDAELSTLRLKLQMDRDALGLR